MTAIRSKNLVSALEFLLSNLGKEYLPDEIKERQSGAFGVYADAITCSHASTGRMLRRAEQRGDIYKNHRLRRGSRRNVEDNEDLTTFFLDPEPFAPAEQAHFYAYGRAVK